MTTANDIIKAAFRLGGITTTGDAPDAQETQDALSSLNDLIASISNDSLFIYARTTEDFTLTSAIEYTIGAGGDFDTARPIDIVSAYIRRGTIDYSVAIISDEQYAAIPLKSTSTIPYFLNYTASYPLGTIKLYPAPIAGDKLFLLSEKPLENLTLNQTLSMPPGWSRYLKNQLAIELAGEYGQQIPPTVVENARDAMGAIKRGAARVKSMDAFSAGDSGNIYSGWNNR